MGIRNHIPNFLTCCNLLCGCLAIVSAFDGKLADAAIFVYVAAIIDFFDGFAARLLNASSPIGKELDSLADMVSFGLVPSVVVYQLLQQSMNFNWSSYYVFTQFPFMQYFPFIIAAFSALRLAKFNIDPRQVQDFIGVPTPANALLICSFPLLLHFHMPTLLKFSEKLIYMDIIYHPGFLCGLSLIMSLLLVSEIRLFSLKFKDFSWANNLNRYIFIGISFLLAGLFHLNATPIIIIFYILWSIIWYNLVSPRMSKLS